METTLTREQILAMPAGRELDQLVAELVIGTTDIKRITVLDGKGERSEPGTTRDYTLKGKQSRSAHELPRYSTNIAHAFEVVEKIHKNPPNIGRYSDSGPWFAVEAPWGDQKLWCAGWCDHVQYEGQGMIYGFHAVAETAALAIARASLLTKLKDAEVKA